jgi:hypothetical protein
VALCFGEASARAEVTRERRDSTVAAAVVVVEGTMVFIFPRLWCLQGRIGGTDLLAVLLVVR